MNKNKIDQDWEQISIEVEPQLGDQLATLLDEILPGGVVLEKNYGDLFLHELDLYQGPVRLYGYFPAERSQEIKERIAAILENSGHESLLQKAVYSRLVNQNWAVAWQERYHPIPVGETLVIVPTWLENPYPERIPVWMDPGMAFGSGTHPTTQLCLTLLEKCLTGPLPGEMIDIGCGSGILSIAASKLGVGQVLGVDIDPDAVQISDENARTNSVSTQVAFKEGSIREILNPDGGVRGASLVVANIIAPILKDLFGQGLGALVFPGGKIILSGILKEQLPAILSCLEVAGFKHPEIQQQDEWVGLIAEKELTW
jgi:ribosomal protein L11 methyltransferase